ncbi:MAG: hypothetical protein NTV22_08780, partial [bacterium]|nr:hypothetical protein [bacterium]
VFNKQGAVLAGPTEFGTLWPSGSPGRLYGGGDPIVLYDALSNRWFLSQFGENGATYYLFIAVSATADPLGAYHLYTFTLADYFPDYPKYGVWPDGYYMASNEADANPWVGIWAFDRMQMLAGTAATYQKFRVQRNFMIPCDYDGSTPPPAGAPNYFYTMMDDTYWPSQGFPGVDRLEIWEYHVDWATPANSTFTHTRDVTNIAYIYDVGGDSWDVIPQKGTSQKVDAIGEWPMYRLQYRNFSGYETLVGNFTVDTGGTHAGVLWFELRKTSPSPWDMQQYGIYAPDADHRWMGSAAMNGYGDIALGYSVSSSTLYPAIRCAARLSTDAPGTLGGESVITNGAYSQTSGNRWGDYSTMSVDPADDATFWYTQEYIGSDNHWRTHIGVFNIVPEPQWSMLALVLAPLVRRRTSPA